MKDSTDRRGAALKPSSALMRAAVSGLLGFGAGCSDEKAVQEEQDPDSSERHEHDPELCLDPSSAAGSGGTAGSGAAATSTHRQGATAEVDKELSTQDVQLTFDELTSMCDSRQGYIQIHGSCSGVNVCAGFTYGNWGEDAQLLEHSCSGVNGCNGLSCLTTAEAPAEGGLTGEEILELDDDWFVERAGQYGPKSCKTCHIESEFSDELDDYVYDYSKLKVPVWTSSGRNADNWLDRSAAYQEKLIAFGARGMTEDGTSYSNMASYAKLFSKEEIQRVVTYMRSFKAENITFKQIIVRPGKGSE